MLSGFWDVSERKKVKDWGMGKGDIKIQNPF
jgi:hypothetical protein